MPNITITITDSEKKALDTVMSDITAWSENFLKVRANAAAATIKRDLLEHCNTNNIAMATGESAQIDQAYNLGVAITLPDSPIPPPTL